MFGTGSEVQTNDFNQVMKEIAMISEVEYEAQVSMDTKTVVVEEPLQVKKTCQIRRRWMSAGLVG